MIDEFSLIRKISQKISINSKNVIKGIGDDCAVIKATSGKYLMITCDCQVEGVHFLKNKSPEDVGRKAIAVNVSDIASMGGKPTFCLISLIIPKDIDLKYIDDLYSGIILECKNYGVEIIGGNISKGKELIIDVFMMGEVTPKELILRSTAKPGDKVLVTGSLGEAAAGLKLLSLPTSGIQHHTSHFSRLIKRCLTPQARLLEGKTIAKTRMATSMIDISDGLSTDAFNLCEQSKVGIKIYEALFPMSNDLILVSKLFNKSAFDLALNGGDDYELLFTVPSNSVDEIVNEVFKKTGTKVSVIGEVLPKAKGGWLVLKNGKEVPLKSGGWDHLRNEK